MRTRVFFLCAGASVFVVLAAALWWRHRSSEPKVSAPVASAGLPEAGSAAVSQPPAIAAPGRQFGNAPAYDPATLSPTMRALLDSQQSFAQRRAAVGELPLALSEPDQDALQAFLLQRDPADAEQRGQVLKNVLLDWLCGLNPPPAWLGDTLVRMYRDRSQDGVIRDYAVQHLVAYYEQLEAARPDESQARSAVRDVLWEALGETDSSIAGTALLGLSRLLPSRPEVDRDQLIAAALQLADQSGASELTRIAALQVCANLGVRGALPLATQVVQGEETVPLRISAVSTLGALGGADQVPLLTNLLLGSEERLKLPARQALAQIQRREHSRSRAKAN